MLTIYAYTPRVRCVYSGQHARDEAERIIQQARERHGEVIAGYIYCREV